MKSAFNGDDGVLVCSLSMSESRIDFFVDERILTTSGTHTYAYIPM